MSLTLEERLKVVLASAPRAVRSIQTLEISHSEMTQTFRLWREPYVGTITTAEDGEVEVQPLNMEIKLAGDEGHLDQSFQIRIDTTDVEDTFREQLDLIPVDTLEQVECIYREYLSDDLENAVASATLHAESISYELGAASIQAAAPRYSRTSTGERYIPRDVPMLRSFL